MELKGKFMLFNSLSTILLFCLEFYKAEDTIHTSQFLRDPDTLASNNGLFELGFFSPENSTNRYVGIWYISESTVVWVANKNQPLKDSSGVLTISNDGNLVILNGKKDVIWSSNVSSITPNSSFQLFNSGNLVLLDATTGVSVWESFQHPSDKFIANMKLRTNIRTGEKFKITSWRSPSEPSDGKFSATLEPLNIPQLFVWNERRPYFRSGPWNGRVFTGIPEMNPVYVDGFNVVDSGDGDVYLTYASSRNKSDWTIFILDSQGKLGQAWLNEKKEKWEVGWVIQESECDVYGVCGPYGTCNRQSSPICSCLTGFKPKNIVEWSRQNWTSGCVRKAPLQWERMKNGSDISKEDGSLKLQRVKVPDFALWLDAREDECRNKCLMNYSCIAYAFDAAIGCMHWNTDLIDIQEFSNGGLDLYIRLSHSEFDKGRHLKPIVTSAVVIGTILIFCSAAYVLWTWKAKPRDHWLLSCCKSVRERIRKEKPQLNTATVDHHAKKSMIHDLNQFKFQELPLFDFQNLVAATSNFDLANKLGQGGFGPVYKGKLENGLEIAVKRLSKSSGQGVEEFMNEVWVISKLQHRNLVRLLGCCIEGEERMLVYEYMPNKSLDDFIFDPRRQKFIDWRKRFRIIEGIARGLLYLHRDSRLRIIHRDLKASNILLDEELNPKISDFGMARIFGGTENEANTRRVVGTYGYMSPEYAMEGLFSEKSDVYSFGVLILEVVSGRRNSSFSHNEELLSLLALAWELWMKGDPISLIAPEISDDTAIEKDICRCIHIGLLCVQELAKQRPTVATIISMLHSEIVHLPPPMQPAFVLRHIPVHHLESSDRSLTPCSINNVTVTTIQGR